MLGLGLMMLATLAARPVGYGADDGDAADLNETIDYFAKVVDQDDKPVAGATVGLWLLRAVPGSVEVQERYHFRAASGQAGTLAVTRLRGVELQLASLKKDGYLLSPWTETAHTYLRGGNPLPHFDADHPQVLRLWRRKAAAAPERHQIRIRVRYDGTPVRLDLADGRALESGTPGGDLAVSLRRETQARSGFISHTWTATIRAMDDGGGIAEPAADDEFMYEAPAAGYQRQVVLAEDEPRVVSTKDAWFFVCGRAQKLHGSIHLELRTGSDGESAALVVDALLNTDGSRLLEYDYFSTDEASGKMWHRYPARTRRAVGPTTKPTTQP